MSYVTLSMNPMQTTGNMRREIERLLHDVVPVRTAPTWQPAGNAFEDAKGFTLQFDVPGFAPDQLEVTAQDGSLMIRGTRAESEATTESRALFVERAVGSFERRIQLPKSADSANIAANYVHGVLTVRVEKLAAVAPRKVAINTGESVSTPTENK